MPVAPNLPRKSGAAVGTAPSGFVWMGVLLGWVYSPGGCGFRGISKLMISPGSLPISCGGSEAVAGMPEGSTTWKDVGCTSGVSPTPGGLCGSIKSMGPLATLTHGLDRCRNGELVGALRRCPRASPRRHSAANSSPSQSRWSFCDRDSIFRVTQTDPYGVRVLRRAQGGGGAK